MYLFRFENGFDVVGSSPEALVKVEDGQALLHPIAGTRHRGATPQEDHDLAEELLADPKERAEHLMLVDLGRNDLGRVCAPGSVEVVDFMSIERYSHVMHIVSTVTGRVAEGRTAFDVLTACFPAGTSPAPPSRAPCRSSRSSNPPGAACTADVSVISISPATRTPPSPSAPPCSATAPRTCRLGRASSPTRPGRRGRRVPQQGRGRAPGRPHRQPDERLLSP